MVPITRSLSTLDHVGSEKHWIISRDGGKTNSLYTAPYKKNPSLRLLTYHFISHREKKREMKDNHNGATPSNPLKGVRALLIRKNSPEELILNRLREYLLYSKLRSLLPSQPFEVKRLKETPMEYEPAQHEIPGRDSDDENTSGPAEASQSQGEDFDYALESDEENEKNSGPVKTFVPSIKIKKLDSTLLISTVVLKNVALSSALFHLLEEEKLDIVYENQYRTETKVVHTIQVNLPSEGLDIDDLEQKLQAWAARRT